MHQVGLDLVCDPIDTPRKTKILCTLGPSCWSEEGLGKLIDAGMNVARFNFSHGTHAAHQEVSVPQAVCAAGHRSDTIALNAEVVQGASQNSECILTRLLMLYCVGTWVQVLDRIRKVASERDIKIPVLLDTKGPEIRTAMLKNHEPIDLEAGQSVTVVAGEGNTNCLTAQGCLISAGPTVLSHM
jgi:pyruvate kinase